MVNEAVNNVRRHTQAQQVWISLTAEADALHLRVRDDGAARSGRPAADFEPRSLTERVRELGGSLAVQRANGLDTQLHITIPV
jgi:signal transduction histidine kinase